MSSVALGNMTGLFALWMDLVLFIYSCLFDFDQADINCLFELRSAVGRRLAGAKPAVSTALMILINLIKVSAGKPLSFSCQRKDPMSLM